MTRRSSALTRTVTGSRSTGSRNGCLNRQPRRRYFVLFHEPPARSAHYGGPVIQSVFEEAGATGYLHAREVGVADGPVHAAGRAVNQAWSSVSHPSNRRPAAVRSLTSS